MKPSCFIMLPLLLLSVLLPPAVLANTWYANAVAGNDTNSCKSAQAACKTIMHAISSASSGDTIMVAPAVYTENLIISFSLNVIGAGANTTVIDGGGINRVIDISSGSVTLSGLTIRHGTVAGNYYGGAGAGIFNSGTTTVIASTITGNLASAICPVGFRCGAGGGGIYNSGKLTISESTVVGNTVQAGLTHSSFNYVATAQGGGIFNQGTMIMSNSTLVGNTAQHTDLGFVRYYGGAISNIGTAIISNSTLVGNTGGGISNNQGFSVVLQNSIVSNNSGSNCSGPMTSRGYNLSSDASCNFQSAGDLNNHDPLLGPLQNNGGPTQTMALLPGSPAIDAGNPAGCTDGQGNLLKTDQRGMPRADPEDTAGCDMGAYERQND